MIPVEPIMLSILTALSDKPSTPADIAQAVGIPVREARQRLSALLDEGKVEVLQKAFTGSAGRPSNVYVLPS